MVVVVCRYNWIGAEGCAAIATALATNTIAFYLLVVQPGNDIFKVSAKRKRGASPFDGEKILHIVVDPGVTMCFVWSG